VNLNQSHKMNADKKLGHRR